MVAMAVPLPAENVDTWRAWAAELTGPRKAEFEASNARHGITRHSAWLQHNPDGSYVVIVLQDGPSDEAYMKEMAQSDDAFDQWFMKAVAQAHGMDMSAGPPPAAEQVI